MSDLCHICGPVKHEAPTVICAPCALQQERSAEARRRLEMLVPLADAVRALDLDLVDFKPAVYNPLVRR